MKTVDLSALETIEKSALNSEAMVELPSEGGACGWGCGGSCGIACGLICM